MDAIYAELQMQGDWSGVRLLDDLRDPGTDHSWMWVLCSATGDFVRADEFVTAVRLRLGAPILDEPAECACCGGVLDRQCRHALRCAPGASTRGHNRVRDTLLGLASLADSASVIEPEGLIPSHPTLRPADVLTSAAFARLAALDVGVVSPDSVGSGTDACAAMHAEKLGRYAAMLPELEAEGVVYRPVVWSCWGRPH